MRHGADAAIKTGVLGEITKGAIADIIAVDGDPLPDIKLLEKTSFVMKDGKVVAK
jgi:imidazolonepropionase-like amidohydrolase